MWRHSTGATTQLSLLKLQWRHRQRHVKMITRIILLNPTKSHESDSAASSGVRSSSPRPERFAAVPVLCPKPYSSIFSQCRTMLAQLLLRLTPVGSYLESDRHYDVCTADETRCDVTPSNSRLRLFTGRLSGGTRVYNKLTIRHRRCRGNSAALAQVPWLRKRRGKWRHLLASAFSSFSF